MEKKYYFKNLLIFLNQYWLNEWIFRILLFMHRTFSNYIEKTKNFIKYSFI